MPGLPQFDGGLAGWFLLMTLVMGGTAGVIVGWSRLSLGVGAAGLVALMSAALWVAPALSQETGADLETLLASAQTRVRKEQDGLAAWAETLRRRGDGEAPAAADIRRSSQARAQAGLAMLDNPDLRAAAVTAAPNREAGGVYVAVSLSMPPEALRVLARDAHRAGARVVIRGLVDGSFKATMVRVRQVFDDQSAGGVAIDPQVFKAFAVTAVPTVIAARSAVEPCGGLGCSPAAPGFDKISGNISLKAALSSLAEEGDSGRDAARAALRRLTE